MKQDILTPRFVEFVPNFVASGMLYISLDYDTAVQEFEERLDQFMPGLAAEGNS